MGSMTVVAIGNDAWGDIKQHSSEFIAGIGTHGINGGHGDARRAASVFGNSFGVGSHANYVQTHSSQHADVPQLCLAYQNMFTRFGYTIKFSELSDDELDLLETQYKVAKEQLNHTRTQILLHRLERNDSCTSID